MHRGKPAYPCLMEVDGKVKHETGMTLRDHWAMEWVKLNYERLPNMAPLELCKLAYKFADCMAEARDYDA